MVRLGLYLPVYGGWFKPPANEAEPPPDYAYVKQVALAAERLGFDSLWIPDHLLNPLKGEAAPSLEAWTLAAALAEATSHITLAHTTLCEAFRHPAVLAKQAATLSQVSGGRFALSLGAGWYRREYEAYGLAYLAHDQRVARAREALQLIRQLWTAETETVDFEGRHYALKQGRVAPRPEPPPPLWYAGMSEASRRLVAAEGLNWLMGSSSPEAAKANVADMQRRLAETGRRGPIEYGLPAFCFVRETDEAARAQVAHIAGEDSKVLDQTLATGLVGSPETVAEQIGRLEAAGIGHVLLQLTPTLAELDHVARLLALLGR